MKKRIYIKHWLKLKPRNYNGKTDLHYLKIANNIYSSLNYDQTIILQELMEPDDIIDLCCFITCYYEDVISQTNIWRAFKILYAATYNKPLPFYTVGANYIDEEINLEDVALLLWYYINTIQDEKFLNPYNKFIFNIAKQIMDILDEDYEYAPENKALKKCYEFSSKVVSSSDQFYNTRAYLQTIFFESYLLYPDIKRRLDHDILTSIEAHLHEDLDRQMGYIREKSETYTFNTCSSLLALNAKDWASAILGASHADYNAVSNISSKITSLFQYKSQSETDVTLQHIASGMLFKMTKKSFDNLEDLHEDNIIYIGLVKYEDEWWFSGNFTTYPFDANIILDQKNSPEARSEVSFLENGQEVESLLAVQKQAFLDFNEGSLIAFLNSKDLNSFLEGFVAFYNDSLKLTTKEKEAARKRAKSDGYFGGMDGLKEWEDNEDLFVVFFNPNSGIEFYDDIVNAFPDKRNPFFIAEKKEDIEAILLTQIYSTEFTNYFVEHYKDQLAYFKIEPYKSYLNDLDFLLRFWKKDHYKTKSAMVLTNENQ